MEPSLPAPLLREGFEHGPPFALREFRETTLQFFAHAGEGVLGGIQRIAGSTQAASYASAITARRAQDGGG